MDQTAGPTVPAPQASAPAVPRAGQAPGLSSDRIPGARLAYRGGVRRGRARGQRPVRLHAGRAVLRRGEPTSGVRYVDQPPLTLLLTRVAELPGLSPTVIRIIPALTGGAVVVAAARFAALFGAGRLGRVLAALTMACTPVLLGSDHVDNTTPLDLLAWTVVLLGVTRALLRDRPRWWLGTGGHEPEASVGGCAAEVNPKFPLNTGP